MNDISDLLFTMAGMLVFSFLMLQANGAMMGNNRIMVELEYEKTAVSLAQSLIDEIRTQTFDQAVTDGINPSEFPAAFTPVTGPLQGMTRNDYTVIDHYHGYTETVDTQLGPFVLSASVHYVSSESPFDDSIDPTFSKRIQVRARSQNMEREVTLNYIKTYF